MNKKPLCPMQFTHLYSADAEDVYCAEAECAWWDEGQEQCAVLSIMTHLEDIRIAVHKEK